MVGVSDQYPRGGNRDPETMPLSVTDPDGDTWSWTDADKQGVPGYQWHGMGPAYTRTYVETGQYKDAKPTRAYRRRQFTSW